LELKIYLIENDIDQLTGNISEKIIADIFLID